uniref:Phospholipid phosphatase-related protein type 1 n=1 Tax=Chelydra serpentina TaxID=8475 RepID=A0A8C3SAB4_CHESE
MAFGPHNPCSFKLPPPLLPLVIMAGTVLLAYYFECTDTFQVHIQGFFCQDGNLMKPYPGTEDESFISPLVLYCVLASTPTAIIFIGEISMYFIKSTRETLIVQEKTILTGECCYLNPLLRRIIRFIGKAVRSAGLLVSREPATPPIRNCVWWGLCDFLAVDCGHRSPAAWICHAGYAAKDLQPPSPTRKSQSPPPRPIENMKTPSQNDKCAQCTTIKTKSSRLAKPVLCLGTLCAAFLTGLNRVSEYRNHCSDVIAGFILGSAVALFLVSQLVLSHPISEQSNIKEKFSW